MLSAQSLAWIEAASDRPGLEAHLSMLCDTVGVEYFSYVLSLTSGVEPPAHTPLLMTNYPCEYTRMYRDGAFHVSDSVVTNGSRSRRPFFWGSPDYIRRLAGPARDRAAEGATFGIISGMTIPVHGPRGECGLFSVATGRAADELERDIAADRLMLELLAVRVHCVAVERIVGAAIAPSVALSDNERVCLDWTLRGKTAWEISRIIGRSKSTVDYHVQTASKKLGAANKVHAAFKALQAGLL